MKERMDVASKSIGDFSATIDRDGDRLVRRERVPTIGENLPGAWHFFRERGQLASR